MKNYSIEELEEMLQVELSNGYWFYSQKRRTIEEMLRMRGVPLKQVQTPWSI
jgi:hypothetical protein